MRRISSAIALLASVLGGQVAAQSAPVAVSFTASDGVVVHGLHYRAPHPRATVLLFHQAGSSKAEYATIAPRLVARGFDALAIDQRSGGDLFGPNLTMAGVRGRPGYLDAKKDLDAALAWGLRRHAPIILWGSSYSAALVFLVAAEHPGGVRAVLAFSPGEYLDGKDIVRIAASRVRAPIFVTSAQTVAEVKAAARIVAAAPARQKMQYVPVAGGVHGASTLIVARNPGGAAANWAAVSSFLDHAVPASSHVATRVPGDDRAHDRSVTFSTALTKSLSKRAGQIGHAATQEH